VDFSWVRQLSDESNRHEFERLENERNRRENEYLVALATVPFVEKLFKLLQLCCEEFNKHCLFPELRVVVSRNVTKKSRGNYQNTQAPAEESAFFTFARRHAMYGVRGMNGEIEFVDAVAVTDVSSAMNMRLDEMSVSAVYKLVAKVEPDFGEESEKTVLWTLDDVTMDGPRLIDLCRQYFCWFIKRTDD
jgi:hypothetical protein